MILLLVIKVLLEVYGRIVKLFLGVSDEELAPQVKHRFESAEPWSLVDMREDKKQLPLVMAKPSEEAMLSFLSQEVPPLSLDILGGTFHALIRMWKSPHLIHCDQDHLEFLINDTFYGSLLMAGQEPGSWETDMRHHCLLEPLPGFFAHGILAKWRMDEDSRFVLESIAIDGQVVTPAKSCWSLALFHLLVAHSNEYLFTRHGATHAIMSRVQTCLRSTTLSTDHPLNQFLAPHFGHVVALDFFIFSLASKHSSPSNPFPFKLKSMTDLFAKGVHDFGQERAPTRFNEVLENARAVISRHAEDFVSQNGAAFCGIQDFADELRSTCFPSLPPRERFDTTAAIDLLSEIIFTATFLGAVDHVGLTDDGVANGTWFRIRRPFDHRSHRGWVPSSVDIKRIDILQRVVFTEVFSGERCSSLLKNVTYGKGCRLHPTQFKDDLLALEQEHPTIFNLDKIPAYIHI
ncbi:hypothetical protein HDU98_011730 [Podochytrium sp. JEL0797]|nr:hypothetical protein HDU98_011730 [Podochytrium sp. JEL0797]